MSLSPHSLTACFLLVPLEGLGPEKGIYYSVETTVNTHRADHDLDHIHHIDHLDAISDVTRYNVLFIIFVVQI